MEKEANNRVIWVIGILIAPIVLIIRFLKNSNKINERIKKSFIWVIVVGIWLSGTGCASITTGRFQRVSIDSYPQDATVTISSGHRGVTPCSFDLQRNKNHVINISKKGHRTAQIMMRKTLCGSLAGNILIGGVIGIGIDAMTGACFKLLPENVYVDLIPGDEDDVVILAPAKRKKEEPEQKKGAEVTTKNDMPVTAKDGAPVLIKNQPTDSIGDSNLVIIEDPKLIKSMEAAAEK